MQAKPNLAPAAGPVEVCLINMPYGQIMRPSIALGILKACLKRAGISVGVECANLRFAEAVGLETVGLMAYMRTDSLLGEWTFSEAAFRTGRDNLDEISGRVRAIQPSNIPSLAVDDREYRRLLIQLRDFSAEFVDEIAHRVLARKPKIVGCSSTFEQHCPSLAVLRRIKELDPEVITLMGGANCESSMGWATLRMAPWVDFAVSGEADELIAPLCQRLMETGPGIPVEALPVGVLSRAHVAMGRQQAFSCGKVPRAVLLDMNKSPAPDYDEYFALLEQSPLRPHVRAALPVESSRGCWWGQKSHCTFCGLNGAGMNYRAKSAEQVLEEWKELSNTYQTHKISVTDNIIDMGYLKTLLPRLTEMNRPFEIFYETKANLRREQVNAMWEAGITLIQPGIESLHNDLLKLMAKGNNTMINVQLLKYTREIGMAVIWYLLVGFPGEKSEWHEEVASWLPLIFHLQPPNGVVTVRYDRFSVYFNEPEKHGLDLKPYQIYEAIYPSPPDDLRDIAYFFFDANATNRHEPNPSALILARQVMEWKRAYNRQVPAVFCVTDCGDCLQFYDTRPCAPERRVRLDGIAREIYLACEPATSEAQIVKRFASDSFPAASVKLILDEFVARKLMLNVQDKYLALACFGSIPTPAQHRDYPVGHLDRFDAAKFPDVQHAWDYLKSDSFELGPAFETSKHSAAALV